MYLNIVSISIKGQESWSCTAKGYASWCRIMSSAMVSTWSLTIDIITSIPSSQTLSISLSRKAWQRKYINRSFHAQGHGGGIHDEKCRQNCVTAFALSQGGNCYRNPGRPYTTLSPYLQTISLISCLFDLHLSTGVTSYMILPLSTLCSHPLYFSLGHKPNVTRS